MIYDYKITLVDHVLNARYILVVPHILAHLLVLAIISILLYQ